MDGDTAHAPDAWCWVHRDYCVTRGLVNPKNTKEQLGRTTGSMHTCQQFATASGCSVEQHVHCSAMMLWHIAKWLASHAATTHVWGIASLAGPSSFKHPLIHPMITPLRLCSYTSQPLETCHPSSKPQPTSSQAPRSRPPSLKDLTL
jgi:hypothetical protein